MNTKRKINSKLLVAIIIVVTVVTSIAGCVLAKYVFSKKSDPGEGRIHFYEYRIAEEEIIFYTKSGTVIKPGEYTGEEVTVKITTKEEGLSIEYKLGDSEEWIDYTDDGFSVDENTTIEARLVSEQDEFKGPITKKEVTNIAVCKIGDTYYKTVGAAIAACPEIAGTSQTKIELLTNVTESVTIPEGKNIILDICGTTITSDKESTIVVNGTFNLIDSAKDGKVEATNGSAIVVKSAGNFTIGTNESEPVVENNPIITGENYGIVVEEGGELNFYDGEISGKTNAINGTVTKVPDGYAIVISNEGECEVATLEREYMVSFDANGGTASFTNKNVTINRAYGNLPTVNEREGYEFLGWETADNQISTNEEDWEEGAINIKGKLESNHLRLRLKNYLRVSPNTKYTISTNNSESINIRLIVFYDENYNFIANGETNEFILGANNGQFTTPSNCAYMKATLIHSNGSSAGAEISLNDLKNANIYLSAIITDTTKVVIAKNHTLKAKWVANEYTINYHSNGGSGTMDSIKCTYDKDIKISKNTYTSPKGYTFKEWNTKADGTGTSYKEGDIVKNLSSTQSDIITLYAIWSEVIASTTINGVTTNYDSVQNAIDAAGTNTAVVTLLKDEIDESVTIAAGQSITLNTNGKTLKSNETSITNYGTLAIEGEGVISNTSSELGTILNNATLNITNGTISSENYNAIMNEADGVLTISGGVIEAETSAIYNCGTSIDELDPSVKIEGGTIGSNANYCVENISTGTIVVNDGKINKGVVNRGKATVIINGGTIDSRGTHSIKNYIGNIEIHGGVIKSSPYYDGVWTAGIGNVLVTGGTITGGTNGVVTTSNNGAGTITITGGTIEATGGSGYSSDAHAVHSNGIVIIGNNNDSKIADIETPILIGSKCGICLYRGNKNDIINFYDGIIKVPTDATLIDGKVADTPTGYRVVNGTETIDGVEYKTAYLDNTYHITFDENTENAKTITKDITYNNKLGTLPVPETTVQGYIFDGWYTDKTEGTKITEDILVTDDVTYYAHWTEVVASTTIDGVTTNYGSVQNAIDAAGTNTAVVTLLKDEIDESVTIAAGQSITLNTNGKTLKSNETTITNDGTLAIEGEGIVSGEKCVIDNNSNLTIGKCSIKSTKSTGIRNMSNANLVIDGAIIEATGIAISNLEDVTVNSGSITGAGQYTISNNKNITISGGIITNTYTGTNGSYTIICHNRDNINGEYNKSTNVTVTGGLIQGARNNKGVAITTSNEYTNGTINVLGGTIENNGDSTTGAAIQNFKGETLVSGGAVSSVKTKTGSITITGGTIGGDSNRYGLEETSGIITIGTNDETISTIKPLINARIYMGSTGTLNFYDGIIKVPTDATLIDGEVTDTPTGYRVVNGTETIDGVEYKTAYLDKKGKVEIPTSIEEKSGNKLAYNGEVQTGVEAGDKYDVVGNTATNAGSYTAEVKLKDTENYEWADGTIENKMVEWSIAKATVTPTAWLDAQGAYVTDGIVGRYDGCHNTENGHDSNSNSWYDISGNGNNGTIVDGTASWGDNYLTVNSSMTPWVNLGEMNSDYQTLEVTFELEEIANADVEQTILANWESGGGGIALENKTKIRCGFFIDGGYRYIIAKTSIEARKIYNVVLTYDGQKEILYVNGVKEGEIEIIGKIKPPNRNTVMALNANPTGDSKQGTGITGKIYSAAIYNRGLNADEVAVNAETDLALATGRNLTTRSLYNKIYDGTTNVSGGKIELDGVVDGDIVTANGNFAYATANVGTEKEVNITDITLAGSDKDNYELSTTTISAKGNIEKAELTTTYEGETITYGEMPALKLTITGFVNCEDSSVLTSMPSITNTNTAVGEYTLTPEGGEADNYTFTYVSGKLVINDKTSAEASLSQSEYTYDGNAKTSAITLVDGENKGNPSDDKTLVEEKFSLNIEVKTHSEVVNGAQTEVKGGKINSSQLKPYEVILKGGSNDTAIEFIPDDGYRAKYIKVNGNVLDISSLEKKNHIVVLGKGYFKNVQDDINIVVEFEKIPAKVIVKYQDVDTKENLIPNKEIIGFVNDEYNEEAAEIKGFLVAAPQPENNHGKMAEDIISVTYLYTRRGKEEKEEEEWKEEEIEEEKSEAE